MGETTTWLAEDADHTLWRFMRSTITTMTRPDLPEQAASILHTGARFGWEFLLVTENPAYRITGQVRYRPSMVSGAASLIYMRVSNGYPDSHVDLHELNIIGICDLGGAAHWDRAWE